MHDNLKLEGREKVVQKMSRDGLVEENLADKSTKRVSSRVQDADFSLLKNREAESSVPEEPSRAKRMQRRYAARARDAADPAKTADSGISGSEDAKAGTFDPNSPDPYAKMLGLQDGEDPEGLGDGSSYSAETGAADAAAEKSRQPVKPHPFPRKKRRTVHYSAVMGLVNT